MLGILGTGGYTLPTVKSDDLLTYLEAPKDAQWLLEKTGIEGHSLNFDCKLGKKRTDETVLDYAEHAAWQAIGSAEILPEKIDQLCFATCTPDQIHFSMDVIKLHKRLGLRGDAVVDQIDGGCAALSKAFQLVWNYAQGNRNEAWTALIVGANDVSSFLDRELYQRVDAWLSPAVFSDGAGALVLGPGGNRALRNTRCEVDGDHPLVSYCGGGGRYPTSAATLDEHAYIMNTKDIAIQFRPALCRTIDYFLDRHTPHIARETIVRWYVHQANFRLIQAFAAEQKIPMDRVPHNVDVIGNTVSASTLLLLHEDIRNGHLPEEGPIVFLFVGAGMMEGGALFF